MKRNLIFIFWLIIPVIRCVAQERIIPGAERMDVYVPLLKGKTVAIFANQTSMVKGAHLVDTLLKRGVKVVRIFGPEHGFRGNVADGERVENFTDKETGIEVVSLYGKHNKPTKEDLKGIDIMIFDIQDVGSRFYTFISSLEYYIEAACENSKPLLILDRPNPNGFYVDGPVLEPKFKSFVGMQPVPIVYGMTIGEYAFMIAGEKWLNDASNKKYSYYQHAENSVDTPFHFLVIKCLNYNHGSKYILPVKPSPNLPSIQSIYWYPSTCFFEGTVLSEGRGTDKPFQIFGHPSLPKNLISFIPRPREGATSPKLNGRVCYGWNISGKPSQVLKKVNNRIQLKWIIQAYKLFPDKENFFLKSDHFNQLAGNDILMQQIKDGISEDEIRKSWGPQLDNFKKIRKKYLLYKDFE
ncbi:MAG TPA: DUF1343 domain-containing protein [Chitinophagaceae bacterium]|nr:DUF1343 domain-containing protein [Chitinophagaceae bacterium]